MLVALCVVALLLPLACVVAVLWLVRWRVGAAHDRLYHAHKRHSGGHVAAVTHDKARQPQQRPPSPSSSSSLVSPQASCRARKVVFLQRDLGLGGSERLVVDAAVGLREVAAMDVTIVTTHHDRTCAFRETVNGDVRVRVRGDFLPRAVCGRLQLPCMIVRMLYAAVATCWTTPDVDCFVVDQVAAVMPLLRVCAPHTPVVFYCHFPNKLCDTNRDVHGNLLPTTTTTRNTPPSTHQQQQSTTTTTPTTCATAASSVAMALRLFLHRRYCVVFDKVEELSMRCASCVLYNSRFTRHVTLQTFPSLARRASRSRCSNSSHDDNDDVLYPPVAPPPLPATAKAATTTRTKAADDNNNGNDVEDTAATAALRAQLRGRLVFVSINRYEEKKNIGLAIRAFALLRQRAVAAAAPYASELLLVIAGVCNTAVGLPYADVARALEVLAYDTLALPRDAVLFLRNISDAAKATLLRGARALVYTPANEHFGIGPVEAMQYGKPVIAVAHGGPCESVGVAEAGDVDVGGLLCAATPDSFADAMAQLAENEALVRVLGMRGKRRVAAHFTRRAFSTRLAERITSLCCHDRSDHDDGDDVDDDVAAKRA